ncbi:EamA family transporter RarD [Aquibaculum arenosum]|uniref:EamA family transporter RarD n=1 Tax=Aquibaculum arenosum TaxID=3032591 RepID=A0ABT5YS18_9PROT|nr:EamA family transporter RarD [Fodinicurvata sp. CAU 1616]MDF2097029.1 EamA family transporter RarD [Fodinicurvata sp. CAU 1616]
MTAAEIERQRTIGVGFGLATFIFWGLAPIYFRQVAWVDPYELLAHRVVWSALVLAPLVILANEMGKVRQALRDGRTLLALAGSTLLISLNWLIFIIAIVSDRLLEVSLGYYLNPLINVLLGLVFLRERMGRLRWLGVALGAIGVANLALRHEGFPWISISLALCFGFYGLIRKQTALGARDGLFLETILLLPLALAFLLWMNAQGTGAFLSAAAPGSDLMLMASGVVTAVPLLWFAAAARRLELATIGVMQYIAPTLQFFLAVLVYGEAFTSVHAVTFVFIWVGVVCFIVGSLMERRA